MIWLFSGLILSISIDLINLDAFISGTGVITKELVRSKAYTTYQSIYINEGPDEIAREAFHECRQILSIHIPSSIKKINPVTLSRCTKLKTITLSESSTFFYCDNNIALYSYDKKTLYFTARDITSFNFQPGVETIIDGAFFGMKAIESITIPKSVKTIGAIFNENYGIKKLEFESGSVLTNIPANCMWYHTIIEIHIPPSVTKIGSQAMMISDSIKIIFDDIENSNCTSIGTSCFSNFAGTEITLPPRLTALSDLLFDQSITLQKVNIPEMCTKISSSAFSGCTNLQSITINKGNTAFSEINGSIYSFDRKSLIFIPEGSDTLTIAKELEEISAGILQTNSNLKNIIVNESNTMFSSENGILYNKDNTSVVAVCGGITEPTFLPSVKNIAYGALADTKVTSVTFSPSDDGSYKVTTFDKESFAKCNGLTSIWIPPSVVTFGSSCFLQCTNLVSIEFAEDSKLDTLNAKSLEQTGIVNIEFPSSLRIIASYVFTNCVKLKSVSFKRESKLESIGYLTFGYLPAFASIKLPSSLVEVQERAFQDCRKLVVDFSEATNLKTIGIMAFSNTLTKDVTLSNKLESIGNNAFENSPQLKTVSFNLNSPIENISSAAFQNCVLIDSIFLPINVKNIDPSVFKGCTKLLSVNAHPQSKHHKTFESLLYDYDMTTLILCPPGRSTATVSNVIAYIGSNAFFECTVLETVTMLQTSNLKEIRESTFSGCVSLTSIDIPSSVEKIGLRCFSDCSKLSTVNFNDGSKLSEIGESLFEGCVKLTSVNFGSNSSLSKIGASSFVKCSQLTQITIPSNVSDIGGNAFAESGIRTINFEPNSKIETIKADSFKNAISLSSFVFPDGCRDFEAGLFDGCSSLFNITFSSKITEIPDNAFEGLNSLKEAHGLEQVSRIGRNSFKGTSLSKIEFGIKVERIEESAFEGSLIESVKIPKSIRTLGRRCFYVDNLRSVYFCGNSLEEGSNDVFYEKAVIYVSRGYTGTEFCGFPAIRALDIDTCEFVGTSPNSSKFTLSHGGSNTGLLLASFASIACGDSNEFGSYDDMALE